MFSVQNLMIDEADEAMPGQQTSRKRSAAESPSSPRPNKRKPGTFSDLQLYIAELLCSTPLSFIMHSVNDNTCVIASLPLFV